MEYPDITDLFDDSNIESFDTNTDPVDTPPVDDTNNPTDDTHVEDDIIEKDAPIVDPTDSTLEVMFNFLREKQALRLPEDYIFDGSEESFTAAIEYSKELDERMMFEELLESLPEDYRETIMFGLRSGKPLREFIEYTNDVELDALDLNREDDQIKLLNKYYTKVANFSPERAQKLINNLRSSGELYSAATEYYDEIKELDQSKAQELVLQAQQEREAAARRAMQQRQIITSAIDTDLANDPRKQQLKAFLFNEIATGKSVDTMYNKVVAQIQQNPAHLAQLANILMDYSPDKGIVLDRFTQSTKSNTIKGIKQQLIDAKSNSKASVTGTSTAPEKKSFDWDAYLAQLG